MTPRYLFFLGLELSGSFLEFFSLSNSLCYFLLVLLAASITRQADDDWDASISFGKKFFVRCCFSMRCEAKSSEQVVGMQLGL